MQTALHIYFALVGAASAVVVIRSTCELARRYIYVRRALRALQGN